MAVGGRPERLERPEVIWARPQKAGRGPRPAHSREEIAAAGVRVADADGLDAVSMRRIAAEIGCGTMSLYNYVPRKEDLHELMFDAASGEYELPERPSGDWRADLLKLTGQTRALMHRHPWMPRLMSPVYGFSPNALRYLESCLTVLEPLDAETGTKLELIAMINAMVTTFVSHEVATAERARALPWTEEQDRAVRGAYLGQQMASGDYPRLAASLASPTGPTDLDAAFDRSMNRILDAFDPSARGRG